MSSIHDKSSDKKTIILAISLIVITFAVIAIGISLIFRGTRTPPSYTFSNHSLVISGQFGKTIDLSGATVEYKSNGVPVTPIHTNGAGLGKIERGMFSLNGGEVYKNIMDDQSPFYILLTDQNGRQYYLNCGSATQTEELYQDIAAHMP